MIRSALLAAAVTAVVASGGGVTASASPAAAPPDALCTQTSAPVTINLGVFAKGPLLSVATAEGYFAQQNVTVNLVQVKGSKDQFTGLMSGATDLILTAADNVVNYRLNTSNDLHAIVPVTAVAGLDGGYNLQLFATPQINAVTDLRGKTLGVDSTNSGFAFIAYDILAQHGLTAPSKDASGSYASPDYTIAAIGGAFNRYLNITGSLGVTTTVDATLLSSGFDVLASAHGLTGLDDVRTVASPYLSGVIAGLTPWLQSHRCETVRFLRALAGAARFTTDPANAAAVTADIQADAPAFAAFDPDYASASYAVTVTPVIGQYSDLKIDQGGLLNVLTLRQKYGGFDQPENLDLLKTPGGGVYTNDYMHVADLGRPSHS